MSKITTHVLDTSLGRPAANVAIVLEREGPSGTWEQCGAGKTDGDGRARELSNDPLERGNYRLRFDTGSYFRDRGQRGFYPSVTILFEIEDTTQHYHVPLLLNPFGYSTYRGS